MTFLNKDELIKRIDELNIDGTNKALETLQSEVKAGNFDVEDMVKQQLDAYSKKIKGVSRRSSL